MPPVDDTAVYERLAVLETKVEGLLKDVSDMRETLREVHELILESRGVTRFIKWTLGFVGSGAIIGIVAQWFQRVR